jgi:hypothetical protein
LKIAFIHYHLKPGGVTTVLRHQVRVLQNCAELLVVSGEPPPAGFPCATVHIPGAGYSHKRRGPSDANRIAKRIFDGICHHFGGPCDLVHIHNPLLAKNHSFLEILSCLQQYGIPLLLQVHDFAEDGRPLACFHDSPYPRDCHYGVINLRDYRIAIDAGLVAEGLHYLPNGVVPMDAATPYRGETPYVLYPVRAIRRKNIGEAILLSHLLPRDQVIGITQPPNSAMDMASYNDWQSYARAHHLRIHFEMGTRNPFPALVAGARQIMNTSIAEGFGFVFLEPWTAGKFMTGRLLPEICQDFTNNGIRLGHLYPRIEVPQQWVGRQAIHDRFEACLEINQKAFGPIWPADWHRDCLETLDQNEHIDFGLLDEHHQKRIIEAVRNKTGYLKILMDRNPFLERVFSAEDRADTTHHNRTRVNALYGADNLRRRLLGIYGQVVSTHVRQSIDRQKLLAGFLSFENFSLLKWNPYHVE